MMRDLKGKFIKGHPHIGKNIGDIMQGKNPWNKGTKGICRPNKTSFKKGNIPICPFPKGHIPWSKGKHIQLNTGRTHFKKGQKPWNKGIKSWVKPWAGKKRPNLSGKNHPFWKGGITLLSHALRCCPEIKRWRDGVFVRDNYTCQTCHSVGGKLHAHHIVSFASILNEIKYAYKNGKITFKRTLRYWFLWNTDNGITLCKKCHFNPDFMKLPSSAFSG